MALTTEELADAFGEWAVSLGLPLGWRDDFFNHTDREMRMTARYWHVIEAYRDTNKENTELKTALGLPSDMAWLKARIGALERKIADLKEQLTMQRDNNNRRNKELDALHYVWCSGGCKGGIHRYDSEPPPRIICKGPDDLDGETVDLAVRNTRRLVAWYSSYQGKLARRRPKPKSFWRKLIFWAK